MKEQEMIDPKMLEIALMNAVKPHYDIHVRCPECKKEVTTDNGEWLLWCGDKEHAQVILGAARAHLAAQKDGMVMVPAEPTEKMITMAAGHLPPKDHEEYEFIDADRHLAVAHYRAMLAAANKQEG